MKRWAFVTVLIYFALLTALAAVFTLVYTVVYSRGAAAFAASYFVSVWRLILVFLVVLAPLLAVPMREIRGKPVRRRDVLSTVTAASLLMAALVLLTFSVLVAAVFGDAISKSLQDLVLFLAAVSWLFWFFLTGWLYIRAETPSASMAAVARVLLVWSALLVVLAIVVQCIVSYRRDIVALYTPLGIVFGIAIAMVSQGPRLFYHGAPQHEKPLPDDGESEEGDTQ